VQYDFIATNTETMLKFGFTSDGTICGPRIDDVRVVLISLPRVAVLKIPSPVVSIPNDTSSALVNSSPVVSAPIDTSPVIPVQDDTNCVNSPIITPAINESTSSPNYLKDNNGMSISKILSITSGCIGVCLFAGMAIYGYRKYQERKANETSDAQIHWNNLMKPSSPTETVSYYSYN
jgi:hypothetical protein